MDTGPGAHERFRRREHIRAYETEPALPSLAEISLRRVLELAATVPPLGTSSSSSLSQQQLLASTSSSTSLLSIRDLESVLQLQCDLNVLPADMGRFVVEEILAKGQRNVLHAAKVVVEADLRRLKVVTHHSLTPLLGHPVKTIDMTACHLDAGAMSQLKKMQGTLRELRLAEAQIKNLNECSFDGLDGIETLDLRDVTVDAIPAKPQSQWAYTLMMQYQQRRQQVGMQRASTTDRQQAQHPPQQHRREEEHETSAAAGTASPSFAPMGFQQQQHIPESQAVFFNDNDMSDGESDVEETSPPFGESNFVDRLSSWFGASRGSADPAVVQKPLSVLRAILHAGTSLHSLRVLNLTSCKISNADAVRTAGARFPPLLQELYLCDNNLDEGIFRSLLPLKATLQVLEVSKNKFSPRDTAAFFVLRQFRALRVLGLNETEVDDGIMLTLFYATYNDEPSLLKRIIAPAPTEPLELRVLGIAQTNVTHTMVNRLGINVIPLVASNYSMSNQLVIFKYFANRSRSLVEHLAYFCLNYSHNKAVMQNEVRRPTSTIWNELDEIEPGPNDAAISDEGRRWNKCLWLMVQLMKKHTSVMNVCTNAIAIIHALLKDRPYPLPLALRDETLFSILDAMQAHPNDKQMQENACVTLSLFQNPIELERYSRGVARALMACAANFPYSGPEGGASSGAILPYVAHLMIGLSSLPLAHKIVIGGPVTIQLFLNLLDSTQNVTNIQALGFAALWNISDSCTLNCENLVDCGGIKTLVNALKNFNLPQQQAGGEQAQQLLYLPRSLLGVLGNISECPSCRTRMMANPDLFVKMLAQLSRCLMSNHELQYLAGCVIVNVILLDDAFEGATGTLMDYVDDEEASAAAATDDYGMETSTSVARLVSPTMYEKDVRHLNRELRKLGLIEQLHQCVTEWPIALAISVEYSSLGPMILLALNNHPTVRLYATFALTTMCFKNDKHRELIVQNQGPNQPSGLDVLQRYANDMNQASDVRLLAAKGLDGMQDFLHQRSVRRPTLAQSS